MIIPLRFRYAAAILLGIAMSGLMSVQAYAQFARSYRYRSLGPFFHSRTSQFKLQEDVLKYRQRHGQLPEAITGEEFTHANTDAWGNVFHYRVVNDAAVIRSLGQDGVEGGTGADTDFGPETSPPRMPSPTWQQFLADPLQRILIPGCVLIGLLTAFMLWGVTVTTATEKHNFVAWMLGLIVTVIVAGFVGMVMVAFHDPMNGH